MIVIDASALLDMLLGKPEVAEVRERLLAPHQGRHAPHLLDVEVAQVADSPPQAKSMTRGAPLFLATWWSCRSGAMRTICYCCESGGGVTA